MSRRPHRSAGPSMLQLAKLLLPIIAWAGLLSLVLFSFIPGK